MAKYYDVKAAFSRSIMLDPKRGRVVTTERFVQELAKLNHFWSLREANDWIEHYQNYFRDYTDHHGDNKCYFMMNMGYVM
ncbi:DNA polymerase V [Rahnella aceris]